MVNRITKRTSVRRKRSKIELQKLVYKTSQFPFDGFAFGPFLATFEMTRTVVL